MIYVAEVFSNLQAATRILAFLSTLVVSLVIAIQWAYWGDNQHKKQPIKSSILLPFIPLLFLMISIITPSSKTVYMIAGSEAGEQVVNSEEGKEILSNIKTILNSYIKK
jgi:hypothetical protein